MKLKYKKIMLVITTFTMMIGMVIFSIISPSNNTVNGDEAEILNQREEDQTQNGLELEETQIVVDGQEIVLEKSVDSKLNQLLIDYFNASVACDMDKLSMLVSDVSILQEEELRIKYELVEAVENVQCYVVKTPSEGKYLVYVYSEIKFRDIATMAPGLSRLTVVDTEDEGYVIFFGADEEVEEFAKITDTSAPVQEMVQKVSLRMEEAVSTDADLKALNEKMTGSAQTE